MGRQNSGTTTVAQHSSSIALLQERFRQLQRVKEMREEREQLRLFAEPDQMGPTNRCEPSSSSSTLFFHPELIRPSRPQSTSIRPDPTAKIAADGQLSMSLWPDRQIARPMTIDLDETEVDTSLHL
ncbi:hypothetical protein ACLOJK_035721 [Asimina triloba]